MEDNAGIPLDVIAKGRDLEDVITAYLTFHTDACEVAADSEKPAEEILAGAMTAALYRLYLMGVADGMK